MVILTGIGGEGEGRRGERRKGGEGGREGEGREADWEKPDVVAVEDLHVFLFCSFTSHVSHTPGCGQHHV